MFKQSNHLTDAIVCYDQCISMKQNTAECAKAYLEKASLFVELKRYREAIELHNKLITMKLLSRTELIRVYEEKANACCLLKKYAQAAESFKKAIELNLTGQVTENITAKPNSLDNQLNLTDHNNNKWSKGTGFSTGSIMPQWNVQNTMTQQLNDEEQIVNIFQVR